MIEYIFLLSGIIILLRLVRGATFGDRVIALNTVLSIIALLMVIYSLTLGEQFYLDMAIVIAILSFIGVLAISKFAVRK